MKIGVVDDGVDHDEPVPRRGAASRIRRASRAARSTWTTPKVIVARAFPGPSSGTPGRSPLDPQSSFHGTHVAGIAAGDAGTTAPARRRPSGDDAASPASRRARGSATTASSPCRRRSATSRTRRRSSPRSRRPSRDGMDVINFSGGGPQAEPVERRAHRAVAQRRARRRRPGDLGRQRPRRLRLRHRPARPATRAGRDLRRRRLEHARLRAGADVSPRRARRSLAADPVRAAGSTPPALGERDQTLVDVGSIVGTDGQPVERHLCGSRGDPNGAANPLPAHSLTGAIALVSRGVCTFVVEGASARRRPARSGSSSSTTASARRTGSRSSFRSRAA